ncbi:unnamed protein product, partial [Didymodactylos carnosus]
ELTRCFNRAMKLEPDDESTQFNVLRISINFSSR